ncbi:MAG: DNA-3-methyladenine glycosylase family protein [Xenococcaceae cyanobacterium]
MNEIKIKSLTPSNFDRGLKILVDRDRDLAGIFQKFGAPPIWSREPGFTTLVQIILEQQVSLASAKATYNRLNNFITLTPENFLTLNDDELRAIGLSRQKTSYIRALSQAIATKKLNLDRTATEDDETIRLELKQIKGIGDWTVDMYLLMALQRPDIFAKSDLAVVIAVQKIKNLVKRPTTEEMLAIASNWQPWRSIATQLLWHYYLNLKVTGDRG